MNLRLLSIDIPIYVQPHFNVVNVFKRWLFGFALSPLEKLHALAGAWAVTGKIKLNAGSGRSVVEAEAPSNLRIVRC